MGNPSSNPVVKGFFDKATATWTYVVRAENSRDCAIIDSVLDYDPASGRSSTASADKVISCIKAQGLNTVWILETHIHADHLTAARYLKEKLGGKTGVTKRIMDVLKTWQPVFNSKDIPADGSQFDHLFEDGEVFSIGPLEAKLIPTPGHTPADTSFLTGDAAFVGDAIFLPDVGTGRCDFPGGSAADSYDSTRTLLSLPDDTRLYVGHDYPPGHRAPQCMAYVHEQKSSNILASAQAARDAFIKTRTDADKGKPVPALLLPALQVNLRNGDFGAAEGGQQYIKIPVNAL